MIIPRRSGQVMLLSVLAVGGIFLAATAVAGFLMAYSIRQSSDFAASSRAIMAADAGVEWALYRYTHPTSTAPAPSFGNGASVAVQCFGETGNMLASCGDPAAATIVASGQYRDASRIFEVNGIQPFVQGH